jgi:NAD(P)-dependent dehydrogenase (short-subunit alcohol dehydrogenase family)
MDLGLAGKKAIVTGGSRGIGQAIVQSLINEGVAVATCARGEEALNASLEKWNAEGATAIGSAVDVNDDAAFSEWLTNSAQSLGGVDIFVSNISTRIQTQGAQRWQDNFEVDLLQHIKATETILPYIKNSDSGAIVYIASIASIMSANMPTEIEYGAMKAALISYASQLANTLGKDNIRVNSVSPGPIFHENGFWEMVKNNNAELFKRAEAVSVFNRLGTPGEVANAVTFLASPAASNITGTNLRVDGGAIKTVNF